MTTPAGPVAQVAPSRIAAAGPLKHLAAVVLLSGTVRPTKLSSSIGRSVMELPVDTRHSLLDHWQEQVSELAYAMDQRTIQMRVVVDRSSAMPEAPATSSGHALISVERDPIEFRGTGGVLHDLSVNYDDDEYILVANGTQLLLEPLTTLANQLAARGGDVTLISHLDGTPSGLMLVRCGVLRLISPTGFVDMKEQALPRIAKAHRVMVAHREEATGLPIRTLAEYINALRMHHHRQANLPLVSDPFAENLTSSFQIVQDGAKVDPTARVIDSVVLAGGRVDAGAILVRSIVCKGGVVRREQRVIDRIVTAPDRRRSGGEA